MAQSNSHSRRDFLQGKAATDALVEKAQVWLDATSELLGVTPPAGSVLHLRARRHAMACEFALQFHEQDRHASGDVLSALDLIEELEAQMTIYRDTSELIEINQYAADQYVNVESGLFALLELAARLHRETGGAFDITSSPLSHAWGFLRREGQLPSAVKISEALDKVNGANVQLDPSQQTIRFLDRAVEINLNSIGKGYALDRAGAQLDACGLRDYLWHGGGSSVLARGANRADTKAAWTLGLRHPRQPARRVAEFTLRDQGLATAGGASQFFEHNGRHLSHIIDPRTGWPAEGVLTSTVVAPTAAEADALATAFFVMGADDVADYCELHPEIGAVLVCPGETAESIVMHHFGLTEDSFTTLAE